MLPAYSLMLGLLALVGFMAIAVGVQSMPEFADGFKRYSNNFSVPALFMAMFPSWFVGVAFAAIAIGALVPAAIMSIATANTFTRNIYREFINPDCTDAQESQMAKIVSLVIKAGALVFIFSVPLQYALWLQLLGGIWIIQTVPSVILALYHAHAERLGVADRLGGGLRPGHLDVRDDQLQPGLSAAYPGHDGAVLHRAGLGGGEHRRVVRAVAVPERGVVRPTQGRDGGQRLCLTPHNLGLTRDNPALIMGQHTSGPVEGPEWQRAQLG